MTHVAGRIILYVAALGLAASASAQGLRSDGSSEYLIKAGYIYNFAKLVEWPSAVARKGQPIVITVLGNDAFASVLERVVQGKKVDDRPFVVKRLNNREGIKDCACQILFVAGGESSRTADIVQLQNAASVASLMLTTEALIGEKKEDKPAMGAGGGGGGMGGMDM